jgi:hypothetical protein
MNSVLHYAALWSIVLVLLSTPQQTQAFSDLDNIMNISDYYAQTLSIPGN